MTKNETMRLFKKHFKRWVYMIEHYGWKLTLYYCDSIEDMPERFDSECGAGTIAKFPYLEAAIYVNLKKSADLDEAEIEYIVVHELVHLLVSPLQESNEVTPLEYTVTSLARIIQGLRKSVL